MDPSLADLGPADQAFARFARSGDSRALALVFDETAPELLRVASHLVSDLDLAEDLVQTTFLAAIESRQDYDSGRAVLPWLTGLTTNFLPRCRSCFSSSSASV